MTAQEATFHINGKINKENVRIWGGENPHFILEVECDSPKLNVFCAVSKRVYGPFFSRWIGCAGYQDNVFCSWPPRSPDLTVCDFFLWGHIKDLVYNPPLPLNQQELQVRITSAIESITVDMLERVWCEWEHHLDVCSVTHWSTHRVSLK
ncbi:hypothetical protein C0J52_11379 [Blattella germanica]|nr:hypothetical protein C0J52_11379 [Blattella germanica]